MFYSLYLARYETINFSAFLNGLVGEWSIVKSFYHGWATLHKRTKNMKQPNKRQQQEKLHHFEIKFKATVKS